MAGGRAKPHAILHRDLRGEGSVEMRIVFIRPSLDGTPSRDAMAPLAFAILQALTPPGVRTALFDERIESIPLDTPADLVAMSVETYTARRSYQIAAHFRRRGVPVVMGGHHPSLLPEEALEHADAVVIGDAEGLWPRVLDDAARGTLQRVYRQDAPPPFTGLMPDRSIFRGKRYAGLTLVQSGRGCRFHCEFCSVHAFYGKTLRQRPADEVVEDLRRAGGRDVFFVDDNLFYDVDSAVRLFEAITTLRLRWSCQISLDIVSDPAMVRLMARSGCTIALIGLESLAAENLRQMGKGWSRRLGDPGEAIRGLQTAGIMVYGTFVFGYDGDKPSSFDETVKFALEHRLFLANFNPLTPTPGAALFDRLRREDRLLHEHWWLDPDYRYGQACFSPRGMTAGELAAGCYRARSRFYSGGSIASRLAGSPTLLGSPRRTALYLATNLISRREVHRKQGQKLGAAVPAGMAGAPA